MSQTLVEYDSELHHSRANVVVSSAARGSGARKCKEDAKLLFDYEKQLKLATQLLYAATRQSNCVVSNRLRLH
tara:strand:- start:1008 stop:1226 length:219 start_codon:yes stop_codon:yes gene_type:complete